MSAAERFLVDDVARIERRVVLDPGFDVGSSLATVLTFPRRPAITTVGEHRELLKRLVSDEQKRRLEFEIPDRRRELPRLMTPDESRAAVAPAAPLGGDPGPDRSRREPIGRPYGRSNGHRAYCQCPGCRLDSWD